MQKFAPVRKDLVIYYPPNFDGELHIESERCDDKNKTQIQFRFVVAKLKDEHKSCWDTLVQVARDIIAQNDRQKDFINSRQ